MNLRDEARRLAEEMDSVLSGHISSTNCEYFENVLLSFGRIVREEDAKKLEDMGYAAGQEEFFVMAEQLREKLKTLD